MNIFLEEKLVLQKGSSVKDVCYSKDSKNPLLAVIYDREVLFFNDRQQQTCLPYTSVAKITAFAWNPLENKFMVGHENGLVACIDACSGDLKLDNDTHKTEILKIQFSLTAAIMLTQDKTYAVAFWKFMNTVKIIQKAAPINVALFVNFLHKKSERITKTVKLGFFGDKMGSIEYFEEKRLSLQELCKINGAIKEMFFYAQTQSIIVITSTFYYIQFRISTEEDIVPDTKLKLSMANGPEHLVGIWIEPNTFMLNSKEPTLKFWNIEASTNYSLNIHQYLEETRQNSKLRVNQVVYNPLSSTLVCLLSNNSFIIFQRRNRNHDSNEAGWSNLQYAITSKLDPILKVNVDLADCFTMIHENSVTILRNSCIKMFVDTAKGLKFVIKNARQIEFFDCLDQEVKYVESNEPFESLLISDQTVVVLTRRREIVVSTVLELLNSNNKLYPVLGDQQAIFGLKKYHSLNVNDVESKIYLTKFGYLTISEPSKVNFVGYKTSTQSDYCSNDPEDAYQEVIIADSFDKIALITSKMFLKIFEVTQSFFKILHENIDLRAILAASLNCKPKDANDISEEDGELASLLDLGTATSTSKSTADSATLVDNLAVQKLVIDETGEKVIALSNIPKNNLVYYNIVKQASSYATIENYKEIEAIQFDKLDKRYLLVSEKRTEYPSKKFIHIFVLDESQLIFFDKIEVSPNRDFVGSVFPDIYLGYYDADKRIALEIKHLNIFEKIMQDKAASLVVKAFARDFCFNLSVRRLDKALMALKKVEKSHDMEAFWKCLFDIALDKRNLKIAELCLSKMKFVRGRQFLEMPSFDQGFHTAPQSEIEKLGALALCFNNLTLAKRIFLKEKNYFKLSQILFMEGKYGNLIKLCQKYEKSLLNLYYFEIAKIYKDNKNYSEFFDLIKKSKLSDEFIVRNLSLAHDKEFLEKYARSENSKWACLEFFKFYQANGSHQKAKDYLELNPELKPQLAEFFIKECGDFSQAKALTSQAKGTAASQVYLEMAAHKKNEGDLFASIELLIKGQNYLKAINVLSAHKEAFDTNEAFKNMIIDLLFNQIVQLGNHYAAGALANYFVSINLIEKAVKLYLSIDDCKKAYWLAKTYNHVHLFSRIESKFSSQSIVPNRPDASNGETDSRDKLDGAHEKELHQLLDSGKYEAAIRLLKSGPEALKVDQDITAKARKAEGPLRAELLNLVAKNLKNSGRLDEAIEIYMELKDNAKAFKVMIKANKVHKIIQFANFCREDAIYIQAANYLQSVDIKLNDQVFQSIVLFYCKSKQFKSAIDFMRNFAITCFDEYDFDGCVNILEKIEKLIDRLSEPQRSDYGNLLSVDSAFISKYNSLFQSMNQLSFERAIALAQDLLGSHKSSIFWNSFKLNLAILRCHLNLNNEEQVTEIGSLLESTDLKSLAKLLPEQEKSLYLSINPQSKLRNLVALRNEEEDIDEHLN